MVEIDNLQIATAGKLREDWGITQAKLGEFEPVKIKEPKTAN